MKVSDLRVQADWKGKIEYNTGKNKEKVKVKVRGMKWNKCDSKSKMINYMTVSWMCTEKDKNTKRKKKISHWNNFGN